MRWSGLSTGALDEPPSVVGRAAQPVPHHALVEPLPPVDDLRLGDVEADQHQQHVDRWPGSAKIPIEPPERGLVQLLQRGVQAVAWSRTGPRRAARRPLSTAAAARRSGSAASASQPRWYGMKYMLDSRQNCRPHPVRWINSQPTRANPTSVSTKTPPTQSRLVHHSVDQSICSTASSLARQAWPTLTAGAPRSRTLLCYRFGTRTRRVRPGIMTREARSSAARGTAQPRRW